MLIKENTRAVPEQAVLYKFRVRDFADLFEAFNPEQTHIALEAVLNIVFGKQKPSEVISEADNPEESEEPQNEEEDLLDFEVQLFNDAVMALYNEKMIDSEEQVEDIESTREYKELEEALTAILEHFSAALAEDNFNQDVMTLQGEMEFFTRIEIYTCHYDTKYEILSITLTSTL